MKLTQRDVDLTRYDRTDNGRMVLWDAEVQNFGLRTYPSGRKAFIISYRMHGRKRLMVIGNSSVITLDEARKRARKKLSQIDDGVDPLDAKHVLLAKQQQERTQSVTLQEALNAYLDARKDLKPSTIKKYRDIARLYFPDWTAKPWLAITGDMVERRHKHIGQRAPAMANYVMRALRAVLNFAIAKYKAADGRPLTTENPVRQITQTRAWFKVKRRRTHIKPSDLPAWFNAVNALGEDDGTALNATMRDYLLLLLFTGLRRNEAAALTWDSVDMEGRILTVAETKNGEEHTLPLPDFIYSMLAQRKKDAISPYVFAGRGADHIKEAKRAKERVTKESSVPFILHDLRRTFITVAESLDIPAYSLKRLLNHRINNDVTADYIQITLERLRMPMQKIADYILKCAKQKPSAAVVSLQTPAKLHNTAAKELGA